MQGCEILWSAAIALNSALTAGRLITVDKAGARHDSWFGQQPGEHFQLVASIGIACHGGSDSGPRMQTPPSLGGLSPTVSV